MTKVENKKKQSTSSTSSMSAVRSGQEEAKEKIDAMTNNKESDYYKDNDLIAKTEEGRELFSLAGNGSSVAKSTINNSCNPVNRSNNSTTGDKSVTRSVTWVTTLSKKRQTDVRLDKMDAMLV